MNYRRLCIFDFETDGKDSATCQPVQIAAMILDPRTLKPKPGGKFNLNLKPEGIDNLNEYLTEEKESTIKWHADNYGCSKDEIIKKWQNSCDQKYGWQQFVEFVNKFNNHKKLWTAPIPCGINIKDFDLPIAQRLNNKYKVSNLFWLRDAIDIIPLCFMWFENLDKDDIPSNFRMDTLRDYFGMSKTNAHDAMKDVEDEALVIRKFMMLSRRFSDKVKFKNGLDAYV